MKTTRELHDDWLNVCASVQLDQEITQTGIARASEAFPIFRLVDPYFDL